MSLAKGLGVGLTVELSVGLAVGMTMSLAVGLAVGLVMSRRVVWPSWTDRQSGCSLVNMGLLYLTTSWALVASCS